MSKESQDGRRLVAQARGGAPMSSRFISPPVKQDYDRQIRTSPSSKVWHWASNVSTCLTMGEAGPMPAYRTRCGKPILAEIADRNTPLRLCVSRNPYCDGRSIFAPRVHSGATAGRRERQS